MPSFCILGLFSFAPPHLPASLPGSEAGGVQEVRGSESGDQQLPVREPAQSLPGRHLLHPTKIPFSRTAVWKWAAFAASFWLTPHSQAGKKGFQWKIAARRLAQGTECSRDLSHGHRRHGVKMITPKASKKPREIIQKTGLEFTSRNQGFPPAKHSSSVLHRRDEGEGKREEGGRRWCSFLGFSQGVTFKERASQT